MTDRYKEIRKALAMGPTPGPWAACRTNSGTFVKSERLAGYFVEVRHCRTAQDVNADAHLIAACDPDTIRALLEERDTLAAAIAQRPAGRVHDLAAKLVDELDGLVGESVGVSGLHLNGDVATWDEILPGGRFERLSSLDELRAALAAQYQEPTT